MPSSELIIASPIRTMKPQIVKNDEATQVQGFDAEELPAGHAISSHSTFLSQRRPQRVRIDMDEEKSISAHQLRPPHLSADTC